MRVILSSALLMFFLWPAQAEDPAAEKVFVYCAEAQPSSFNAQLATDGATFNASSRTMYNRLLTIDDQTTHVKPSLAESWKISPSGKEVTFHLRANVKFHSTEYFKPTRTFNADDVIFTFERMRNPKHPFHSVGGGNYPFFRALQMHDIIERIEKVDELKVKFVLKRPEAPFLANLAMDYASIMSAEYGAQLIKEKKMENLDHLPIGTGPFVFRWQEKGKSIRYVANADYFEGPAKVQQLLFLIVGDPQLRLKKIQEGECHLMPEPAPGDLQKIKVDSRLKLMSRPGLNVSYLAMNVEKMPFANRKLRLAIHYALNREEYIKRVFGGYAQVAKNPLPPTMWAYKRNLKDYEYNLEKAKALMGELGMSDGFETELWYGEGSRPSNPNAKLMAELIQKDLSQIGIRVRLRSFEWQEYLQRSRAGEPPMSIQGWTSDNGDPDNFLNNLLSCQAIASGNNRARWCHKKFSFLVDRARVTSALPVRTKFYEEAQQIFKEEIPWVTLAHATVFKVISTKVQGYRISPFGVNEFHRLDIK